MSKAKFEAAKELIDEKRYDEARTILKTIDHPTAAKWLNKLDAIAPQDEVDKPSKPITGKARKKPTRLQLFLLIAFGLIFAVLIIAEVQRSQIREQNIQAIQDAY